MHYVDVARSVECSGKGHTVVLRAIIAATYDVLPLVSK